MKVPRVQTVKIHLECKIYQHSASLLAPILSLAKETTETPCFISAPFSTPFSLFTLTLDSFVFPRVHARYPYFFLHFRY